MLEIILGIISFCLFALYDLGQMQYFQKKLYKITHSFFMVGFVLIIIATSMAVWHTGLDRLFSFKITWLYLVIAFLFFILLIYALFFALPFETTYVKQSSSQVYDRGVYALCRHPGVLFFAGFYLFLWLALGGNKLFWIAIVYTLLNVGYILFQDYITFPLIFSDYEDYKKQVPFLLPNIESVKRCIRTL